MMKIFLKFKVNRHYIKAQEYIAVYYVEPAPAKPAETKSKADETQSKSKRDDGIRYSARGDNYDSDAIMSSLDDVLTDSRIGGASRTLGLYVNSSFVDKLIEIMNRKNLVPADVYSAVGMDRRLFSKVISDRTGKPSKDTCILLCFALKLSLKEALDLLSRAGYTLSHSAKRDVVIEYFFAKGQYDVSIINDVLGRLEMKPIGRKLSPK